MPQSGLSGACELRVGGVVPFTTVDFPGRLAAVVFCQGCPWRCGYCHNAHLQAFHAGTLTWSEVRDSLAERKGFLEAVVFSGGEPTAQAGLGRAIREVRAMGFLAGLHTAGAFPERLESLLPDLDWIGLDIKAPLDARYGRLTGRRGAEESVRSALAAILRSGKPFELRTTVHGLTESDLCDLSRDLEECGAPATRFQAFRPPRGIRGS